MGSSGEDMLLQKIPVAFPPTAEEAEKARRVVCANVSDAREAEEFLRMLGLL